MNEGVWAELLADRKFYSPCDPAVSKNVPPLIGSVSEEGNRMASPRTEEEYSCRMVNDPEGELRRMLQN